MSTPEILYRCPVCERAGFTAGGLHRHHCHSKPARARLTLFEISQAKPVEIRQANAEHSTGVEREIDATVQRMLTP